MEFVLFKFRIARSFAIVVCPVIRLRYKGPQRGKKEIMAAYEPSIIRCIIREKWAEF